MSVEKQVEEATATAAAIQPKNKPVQSPALQQKDVSSHSSDSEPSIKAEVPFAPEAGPAATTKGDEISAAANPARQWFGTLTADERSVAVGFTDGAFLATVLALASPWSRPPPARGRTHSLADEVDWGTMVTLKDVRATYHAFEKEMNNPMATSKGGEHDKAALGKKEGSKKEQKLEPGDVGRPNRKERRSGPSGEGSMEAADSNAYRIQRSGAVKDSALGFATNLFEKVCVVFPSAFRHVSGNVFDERSPFITIRSSYFENEGDEELFLALDSIATAHSDAPFLSFNAKALGTGGLPWMRRLTALNEKGVEVSRVPLYFLLLARFEWAAMQAFLETEGSSTRRQLQSVSVEAPPVYEKKETSHSNGEGSTSSTQYASAHETEVASETGFTPSEEAGDFDASGPTEKDDILNELFSLARTFNDLGLTIDSVTLSGFLSPLEEACLVKNSSASFLHKLDNLLMTPLSWLLSSKGQDRSVDFDMLDAAVESSLRLMSNHGSSTVTSTDAGDAKSNDTDGETLSLDPAVESNKPGKEGTTGATGHKKKRKKNKKKKNRNKSSSTDIAESASTELPSTQGGASVSEKTPEKEANPPKLQGCEKDPRPKVDTSSSPQPQSHDSVAEISEATSVDSSVQDGEISPIPGKAADKGEDITVSRLDGRIIVATPLSGNTPPSTSAATFEGAPSEGQSSEKDDGDSWETVEVRGRGGRKKSFVRMSPSSAADKQAPRSPTASSSADLYGGVRKPKLTRHNSSSRRRNTHRKIIRDILFSVIDSVEEESRRRKQSVQSAPSPVVNPWKNGPPGKKPSGTVRQEMPEIAAKSPKREKTMRDVVLGSHAASPKKASPALAPTEKHLPRVGETIRDVRKKDAHASPKRPALKQNRGFGSAVADQSTAPTYQETVSAVSVNSDAAVDSKACPPGSQDRLSKSDSSSVDTNEAPQNRDRESPKAGQDTSSAPPLTLLSPGNANSANCSVASSLEVPHAGRIHRHHSTTADVNDVGYHLLDVCDRLSRDMSLFMSRRALALSARRRERGAILAALQDCVSAIWPGVCHVELYGSCATQLDLPSSDIDVVVLGLDRNADATMNATLGHQGVSPSKSGSTDSLGPSLSMDEASTTDEASQHNPPQRHNPMTPYIVMPHQKTVADRVMRLAAELEGKPWAIQVNAIPTASVPVIKILADPSRLIGTSSGGDWMAQRQHLAAQAAAAAGKGNESESERPGPSSSQHGYHAPPQLLPWRGSDVANGLLSLDITFEGPEHGGIGSTEFSARVVAEACQEAGLHPDATPFLQVLMVLKELLAQRKLNEPYSGGLSSYALLLLVLALIRERAFIKEELERVEQQNRAMAAGELSSFSSGVNEIPSQGKLSQNSSPERGQRSDIAKSTIQPDARTTKDGKPPHSKNIDAEKVDQSSKVSDAKAAHIKAKKPSSKTKNQAPEGPAGSAKTATPSSSWASIAKKSAISKPPDKSLQSKSSADKAPREPQKNPPKLAQKPSFADAVARPAPAASAPGAGSSSSEKDGSKKKKKQAADGSNYRAQETAKSAVTSGSTNDSRATASPGTNVSPDGPSENFESAASSKPANVTTSASSQEAPLVASLPVFLQGYNDIIEVLCSGETTAGKLLMHFLLFYGQHFDPMTTAIDISGKHERDYSGLHAHPYSYFTPYIPRRTPGTIDPVTGMLTVDPIVVYDPLEGAENNNVARRCFAWNSVRWIFAQSYATLSSAVERSATPPTTPGGKPSLATDGNPSPYNPDDVGDLMDPSSPLLRCLLSF